MDRESPDYYIEKTAESVPDTEKLIEYIRSLPHANGVFHCAAPEY